MDATAKSIPIFNIGIIGLGFIGRLHAQAYLSLPYCFTQPKVHARILAILRSHSGDYIDFLNNLNNPTVTTQVDEFYSQPIDLVDICTPNLLHLNQAIAAMDRGKHVYCEKPLGKNLSDAHKIVARSQQAGVLTHTAFMMRYLPAVYQMKAILENEYLGDIHHFRGRLFHGSYLDPKRPISWRLRHADAGGGVLSDLGIHLLDLVYFLLGKVKWVQCQTRTFITQRPKVMGSSEMETVDVDDWALCMLGLENGATGVIEVTRVAGGVDECSELEIFGQRGSLRMNVENPMTIEYYDAKLKQWEIGMQDYPLPTSLRPIEQLWPPSKQSMGFMLNAHLASAYDFLQCIAEKKESPINFKEALVAQEILEAAYLSASRNSERIRLPLN